MNLVYTIGHSTRSIEEFLQLLKENNIELLVDVRRFPGSRRHPHFNKEALTQSLKADGIDYQHMEELGGRRGKPDENSPNDGWRNKGFQAYADYLNTDEAQNAIDKLIGLAQNTTFALLCAEAVYWRCHRRLIADALVARGIDVLHIMNPGQTNQHSLNDMAQILGEGRVIYPSKQQRLFGDT